jgi:hypothetical protein
MKRLFGGLLLASGILVMTCSGLCSLAVIIGGAAQVPKDPSLLVLPLLFGGIPFLFGFGLFYAGRTTLRHARERMGNARENGPSTFE